MLTRPEPGYPDTVPLSGTEISPGDHLSERLE
jgi:hypothetical protein